MPVTFYGPRGISFHSIEEAWTVYFDELYKDAGLLSADEYHDRYLLFVSGILAGLNVVSSRFNRLHKDEGRPDGTAIKQAMLSVTKDAMDIAHEEYFITRKNKK